MEAEAGDDRHVTLRQRTYRGRAPVVDVQERRLPRPVLEVPRELELDRLSRHAYIHSFQVYKHIDILKRYRDIRYIYITICIRDKYRSIHIDVYYGPRPFAALLAMHLAQFHVAAPFHSMKEDHLGEGAGIARGHEVIRLAGHDHVHQGPLPGRQGLILPS